ncbi:MAG: hypothetical protein ACYC4H_04625 [Desulfocucumaceae bacterium]
MLKNIPFISAATRNDITVVIRLTVRATIMALYILIPPYLSGYPVILPVEIRFFLFVYSVSNIAHSRRIFLYVF